MSRTMQAVKLVGGPAPFDGGILSVTPGTIQVSVLALYQPKEGDPVPFEAFYEREHHKSYVFKLTDESAAAFKNGPKATLMRSLK